MLVPGRPSQPSLMFVGKVIGIPQSIWCLLHSGLTGGKGLPRTLAHYENSYITDVKSLITLAPGQKLFTFFSSSLTKSLNKLDHLFLTSFPAWSDIC